MPFTTINQILFELLFERNYVCNFQTVKKKKRMNIQALKHIYPEHCKILKKI